MQLTLSGFAREAQDLVRTSLAVDETSNYHRGQMASTIPHRIFYVWFGNNRPTGVEMCIHNWRRVMPDDWEIIEVGETPSKWFDFHAELKRSPWLRAVYERKMWAYVSDYVRCKVMHDHGGLYLDTDITLEKDFTPLLGENLFLGWESTSTIGMSLFAAPPRHELVAELLKFYEEDIWREPIFTIPSIMTHILKSRYGSRVKYSADVQQLPGVTLYPCDYFYPWPHRTKFSPSCLTGNSYCIHWWGESWVNPQFDYFLRNKHIPGFDYGAPTGTQLTTEYRLGGLKLLVTKKKENVKCYYLFGFLPLFWHAEKGDKLTVFSFLPFTVKKKEKQYLLKG